MTDQTRWGIDQVQVKNKSIKYQKDLVARAMDQVVKMDESGITDLMIQIEAEYERKYGKNEADDKVVLQDNEVSNRYRTGIEQVSTNVKKEIQLGMILKKLRQMYTKMVNLSTPSKALRHPFDTQVSKLLFICTNSYRSFLQSSKANLFFF